ncbi:MAG: DUF1206 domain-containing protein [Pseudomonas sp.]
MSTQRSLVVLARGGYAARGVLYLIIGFFTLLAALDSTKPKDSHRSLEALLSQRFGYVLVALVVAGLFAFAGWRMLQAIRDVDHHGKKIKGLVIRAGLLAAGIVNGALAVFALSLLIGGIKRSGNSDGAQTKDLLAHLLSWDHSNLLVYLIALVPFGVGIAHIIKGWKASFEKYFEADEDVMQYVRPVSRLGLIARGIVFIEIALLLIFSGSNYKALNPPGMKDALVALQNLPAGSMVLMVMAFGLIAFSVYSFAQAAWRKISMDLPDMPSP